MVESNSCNEKQSVNPHSEDFCGIEPVTLPPEEVETRRPPAVDNEKIEQMYSASNPAIIAILLAFLLLLVVIISVLVARYDSCCALPRDVLRSARENTEWSSRSIFHFVQIY